MFHFSASSVPQHYGEWVLASYSNGSGERWWLEARGVNLIAFLRLDGDLYNSTYEGLVRLEPLVAPGGYIYVDDYGAFRGCGAAVDRYVRELGPAGSSLVLNTLPNFRGKVQALWWRKPLI